MNFVSSKLPKMVALQYLVPGRCLYTYCCSWHVKFRFKLRFVKIGWVQSEISLIEVETINLLFFVHIANATSSCLLLLSSWNSFNASCACIVKVILANSCLEHHHDVSGFLGSCCFVEYDINWCTPSKN